MRELRLYKLITESECVAGSEWIGDEFSVRVQYIWLDEFIEKLTKIFDTGMFAEGGANATLFADYLCLDLCELVDAYVDLEEIFPRSEDTE